MSEETKISFKILSITTEGNTVSVFQKFVSPWAALDSEIKHYFGRKKVPAQINISEE